MRRVTVLGTALLLSGCVYYVPVPTATQAAPLAAPPETVAVPTAPVYAYPYYPYPYYGWGRYPWYGSFAVRGAFRFH